MISSKLIAIAQSAEPRCSLQYYTNKKWLTLLPGNGEIDFHEFSAMMSKYMKSSDDDYIEQVKEAFKIMDMDQNGFIEPQELKEVMTRFGQRLSDVDVEDMIREADMDGDGRVNFDEFEVLMMNSKEQLAL